MKKYFLMAIFIASINSARAQNIDQNIINQQDWITRQQQNQIEENRRLKEQENIDKERDRKKKEAAEDEREISVIGKPVKCFPIKKITLVNANSLSKNQQKKLALPFIGECASAKILSKIITSIQTFYNDRGYVTARVIVPKQNIQSGYLELKILEGKIDEIIIGDNKFSDKMQKFTAFPFLEDRALNLNDINQGIYQINRLPSNGAAMKIIPSDIEGEAKVYVQNQKQFPARATIGYDNLGNEFTGIRVSNISGGFDNLLSLNDAINLSYSTNLDDDNKEKNITLFTAGISVPFGYNTISYNYSRSEFRGTNQGKSGAIRITGFSQQSNATIDRVLLSKGNFRLSSNISLTTKSSASYLNYTELNNSHRKLTIGSFGFAISDYFKNGINLYLKPTYFKGLRLFNAKQDEKNLNSQTPKAQFDYFKLYGSVSKQFLIPKFISGEKKQIPFMFSSEFDSQYAKQTLFGTEQFAVGGYYSVRGFRENFITGDSGYYVRNKVNFNLSDLIPDSWKGGKLDEANIAANSGAKFISLNNFAIEPFYDYGYVKNKYSNNGADGRLSGTGIRTIFSNKYLDASLTYSWNISKSSLITSEGKENKMLFFEVSAKCC